MTNKRSRLQLHRKRTINKNKDSKTVYQVIKHHVPRKKILLIVLNKKTYKLL